MLNMQKDTCMNKLKQQIGEDLMEECSNFIKERREARHLKTMAWQKRKVDGLCHRSSANRGGCSNIIHSGTQYSTGTSTSTTQKRDKMKWVINISDKALTDEEEKLLAHGPNFAIVPKIQPVIQYVAAIEQGCTKLEEGKAEELRVKVKAAIQKIQKPKPSITREERMALNNLKNNTSRMI